MIEKTIGQRIKEQGLKCGYTQESLSALMFIPKSTLSSYENGRCDIGSRVIMELSKVLNTTPSYFYGDETSTGDQELDEVISLFNQLKDRKYKKALLEQLRIMAVDEE